MGLNPERWPQQVRELAAAVVIACQGNDVEVEVRQLVTADDGEHFGWLIKASCPPYFRNARWQIIGWPPPELAIAEPAWYAKLDHLPLGGTA